MTKMRKTCLCGLASRFISIALVLGLAQYSGGDLAKVAEILRLATAHAI